MESAGRRLPSGPSPVYFKTTRLLARALSPADVEAFVGYRVLPDVARFQSWSDYTPEQGRLLIDSMQGVHPGAPGEWYQFGLEKRADGTLVGDLALKVKDHESREAEMGITLAPQHQGKGYGEEAIRGLLHYAFETLRLRRVIAITDADNDSAGKLLERVGLRKEAHFVENVFFKGTWGSEFAFAILSREWTASNPPNSAPPASTTI